MSISKKILAVWLIGSLLSVVTVVTIAQEGGNNARLVTYGPVDGKGGLEISGPYEAVLNWPQPLHQGWTIGGAGVYAESPDRIYLGGRGESKDLVEPLFWGVAALRQIRQFNIRSPENKYEHIITVYDRNGKMVESWEQWDSRIPRLQRIQISPYDRERHIWLGADDSVLQFTHDGKTLVRTIEAKDVADSGFRGLTELAWMLNGDFYVTGSSRVMKFSKDGKYLSGFGREGSGPGEFRGIHGIALDPTRHRMYIADRGNSRVQVFDENGKFLDQWRNIAGPYAIRLTKDGRYLWLADGLVMKFAKYDAVTGKLVPNTTWGTLGNAPGAFWAPHHFDTDSEGNLYVAEDYNGRTQKLVPRKDGNPEQLIGPLQ